jgi:hypothetical protein
MVNDHGYAINLKSYKKDPKKFIAMLKKGEKSTWPHEEIEEKGNLKPPKGRSKLLKLGDDLEETDVDEGVFSRIAQDIEDGVHAEGVEDRG